MLYITTIRVIKTETTLTYVKKDSLNDTHLIEAVDELDARQKLNLYYQSLEVPGVSYSVDVVSIHTIIV